MNEKKAKTQKEGKVDNKAIFGRYAKQYRNLKSILTEEKKTPEEIAQEIDKRMVLDAKANKIPLDAFKAGVAEREAKQKTSQSGKREADKVTRDELIQKSQDFCGVNNLAIKSARGEVKLTDAEKVKAFDAIGKTGNDFSSFMVNAFGVGGISMLWNPSCVDKAKPSLLATHIGGWEDGSKNLRYQYAPRKLPIAKRSGYRDVSFISPIFELKTQTVNTEPKQNEPPKANQNPKNHPKK